MPSRLPAGRRRYVYAAAQIRIFWTNPDTPGATQTRAEYHPSTAA
jgi:hypothetical protein